jgi:aryl-alcohol dehydrogenase-like predicted oxidoreductase
MCRDKGMAIASWAPLGQGRLKTKASRSENHTGAPRRSQISDEEAEVSDVLDKLAKLKGETLHAIVSPLHRHCNNRH